MPPSAEEFERWQEDPVTRWVMEACRNTAQDNRTAWTEKAWASGKADPIELAECRALSDAYMAIVEADYRNYLAAHGEEN